MRGAVRPAVAADAEPIATIYVVSWNAGLAAFMGTRTLDAVQVDRWAADLTTGKSRWWVAEREGRVVGFVGIGPSRDPVQPDLGELDTIAVAPDAWRSGVGGALMDVALAALAADYSEAIVWTAAGYERARLFYEASGWTFDGGTRAGGREVSLRRRL